MGTYINPGNESMKKAVRSQIYVDKTGMLRVLNENINGEKCCFAVSRPRRFGKSQACGMIDAYYSVGCDSRDLFAPFEIASDARFEEHLNKYNVLHFDVSAFFHTAASSEEMVPMMDRRLTDDMLREFPYLRENNPENAADAVNYIYQRDGRRFVIVIDEYDCVIRDAKDNEELILRYLRYLRGFFKTEESRRFLAMGYITGILPLKKLAGESALNNFSEYSMIDSAGLGTFFGFTQPEVLAICGKYGIEPELMRDWYDGYYMYTPEFRKSVDESICLAGGSSLRQNPERPAALLIDDGDEGADGSLRVINGRLKRLWHIYNPNSVVDAAMRDSFSSY